MADRSEVRNAASREQVKRAGRKERDAAERKLAIYESVLRTPDGRELIWGFLSSCGIFESPLHQSGSFVYYNVGRGDVGRELLAYLVEHHRDAYLLMETEARQLEARAQREREAVHTPPAVPPGEEDNDG